MKEVKLDTVTAKDHDEFQRIVRILQQESPHPRGRITALAWLQRWLADHRPKARTNVTTDGPKPKEPNPRYELRIPGLFESGLEDAVAVIRQEQEPVAGTTYELRRIDVNDRGTEYTTIRTGDEETLRERAQELITATGNPWHNEGTEVAPAHGSVALDHVARLLQRCEAGEAGEPETIGANERGAPIRVTADGVEGEIHLDAGRGRDGHLTVQLSGYGPDVAEGIIELARRLTAEERAGHLKTG